MNAADAMNAAIDAAGLRAARIATAAEQMQAVVTQARRLTDLPDMDTELFVVELGRLRDAVMALDGKRFVDTVRKSERIVRTGGVEVFDICGCRAGDACESCTAGGVL